MVEEKIYCSHCKKYVILARSNWSWWKILLYGIHIYPLYKAKDKCSICGNKIKKERYITTEKELERVVRKESKV